MNHRDKIISTIAERECNRIAKRIIAVLKKMTPSIMLSGDDTPLKNIWEEVCVQVQYAESFYWYAYLLTIRQVIEGVLLEVDDFTKQVIWIETDEGMDWSFDHENEKTIPYFEDDIVNHILYSFVLTIAADWRNARIDKYMEHTYTFD